MRAPNDDGPGGARDATEPTKADQNQHTDYSSDDGASKAFDTLRAQLQMCGCGLHEMADRGYFVSHGGVSRQLPDLRAVRQMLVRIGGRA